MPFGARRFDRVTLPGPRARFLPLDLGAPTEYAEEHEVRRLIADNERASCPLDVPEELLALTALEIFAKKNTNTHPTKSALAKRTRDAKKAGA
jgi:hypothetical protein